MTFGMFGTVPLVVFPRRTIVIKARSPNAIDPFGNCITRLKVAGSVAFVVYPQSTEVPCTTSVVATSSKMAEARLINKEKLDESG